MEVLTLTAVKKMLCFSGDEYKRLLEQAFYKLSLPKGESPKAIARKEDERKPLLELYRQKPTFRWLDAP